MFLNLHSTKQTVHPRVLIAVHPWKVDWRFWLACKKDLHVPIVTDVHESYQCAEVATVVDVLQIPAFLCRQTDLLKAAARTGKAVKVKKGQFMAPEDMKYAVDKVRGEGNNNVFLTERGSSFGYHTLVVDMRSLPVMRQYTP